MAVDGLIEKNKGVILKKGKNLKYVYVTETKLEKMENFQFSCADMIGKPYGTAFRVVNKRRLEVIDPIQVEEYRSEYEKLANDKQEEETKDNRNIVDSSESQKLDKQTIMALREDGVAGEKIVEKLIENSATFKDRTEFSKAKYLKKKEKKYIPQFVVLKPSARLLCEMYFFKSPDKILEIRPDTLAQILTWSNVQAGSKVLLMETCRGLIAGSIMERLTTDGTLVQIHQGNNPMRTVVEQFNFTVDDIERLACSFPLEKIEVYKELEQKSCTREELLEIILGKKYIEEKTNLNQKPSLGISNVTQIQDTKETIKEEKPEIKEEQIELNAKNNTVDQTKMEVDVEDSKENTKQETAEEKPLLDASNAVKQDSKDISDESKGDKEKDSKNSIEQSNCGKENSDDGDHKKRKRKHDESGTLEKDTKCHTPRVTYLRKEQRIIECEKAMKLLSEKQFDCLVIAAKYHPKKILLSLLGFLPHSRPFVVYCQHKEPLMDCFVALKDMKLVVNLELTETWYRNLQVLSNRTHPEIVMSATGGYILRGIKVKP